jgi:hypothetical protein
MRTVQSIQPGSIGDGKGLSNATPGQATSVTAQPLIPRHSPEEFTSISLVARNASMTFGKSKWSVAALAMAAYPGRETAVDLMQYNIDGKRYLNNYILSVRVSTK